MYLNQLYNFSVYKTNIETKSDIIKNEKDKLNY